jgi:hypothetical protein
MGLFSKVRVWLKKRAGGSEARRMQDPIYALLRAEVARIGKQFEALPYRRLLKPDATWSVKTVVNGISVSFDADTFSVKKNGDIGFCIDARAEPNRTGVQPSHQFFKRKDGSVYH